MHPIIGRLIIAAVFIGTIGMAVWRIPPASYAGDTPKQYFPLMSADVPGNLDPDFRNYVGLGLSDADGDVEVYTVRGDSSELRQITNNDVTDLYPSFSPNGSQIALTRRMPIEGTEEFFYQLVVVNRDGSGERVVWEMRRPNGMFQAHWSPRGQQLLVIGDMLPIEAWIVGLDGSARQLVNEDGMLYSPEWSPDGRYVSYLAGRERYVRLYVTNVATNATVTIGGNVISAQWAPDSRELVFANYFNDRQSAFFIQPDGSDARLAFDGTYTVQGWVQNGTHIVVESADTTNQNFYLIPRGGGDPVPLTTHTDSRLYAHMDATKSGMLYEQYQSGNTTNIYWISFDTRTPRFIAQKDDDEGLSAPALSQNRTRLLYSIYYCEGRTCGTATYLFRLDDPDAIPQYAPGGVREYLPNSSNRAAVQYSGYPDYNLSTIEMVQVEPFVITRLEFTDAVEIRHMVEWRYLP